jgi:hypothetical protein
LSVLSDAIRSHGEGRKEVTRRSLSSALPTNARGRVDDELMRLLSQDAVRSRDDRGDAGKRERLVDDAFAGLTLGDDLWNL